MQKKADLKGATGVDTFNLAAKSDLASLKADVDKTDIDKLKTFPVDLSKLNNIADNDVVKKTVYDEFVTKVNADLLKTNYINLSSTSGLVPKRQYDSDNQNLEKIIEDPTISYLILLD